MDQLKEQGASGDEQQRATTAAREGHAAAGQQDGGRPAPHAQQSAGETAETPRGKDEREGKTDEGEHD